jgi:hypothetical protein
MATTKVCTKCNEEKNETEFPFRNDNQKYRSWCKICEAERVRIYASENKGSVKVSRAEYFQKNKKKLIDWQKGWVQRNLEAHREYHRVYSGDRYNNDVNFRLANVLRSRVFSAVKSGGGEKAKKTMELLGCSVQHVRDHLESQFTEGMTWKTQGEWHIDHILPCASFNLEEPEEQKKCFHWTNLQPLWAKDNITKGDRLDWVKS